jgi:transcription elongation GreA/GreB family factor
MKAQPDLPITLPSKRALRDALTELLDAELAALERAYRAAREGATHEEAKPENDKDTRALEQSYVARGQALRIEDARMAAADARAISVEPFAKGSPAALGALVVAEEDGREKLFLLAPSGGGVVLLDGVVQVVTTKSPMGRVLLGKRAGDACELKVGNRTRELEIVAVY